MMQAAFSLSSTETEIELHQQHLPPRLPPPSALGHLDALPVSLVPSKTLNLPLSPPPLLPLHALPVPLLILRSP